MDIRNLDVVSKAIIIFLIVIISYLLFLNLLRPFFYRQPQTMWEMMQHMMGGNQLSTTLNLLSLSFAVAIGFFVSLLVRTKPSKEVDEYKILKRGLSEDEKAVIKEVKRAGKITQDSLRFRLGWTKAKVSRILTNLDKMNLIQRERMSTIQLSPFDHLINLTLHL